MSKRLTMRSWLLPASVAVMLATVAGAVTPVSPPTVVPVLLRHDPAMDACPALARASLPRGGPDGFLSLRTGPGTAWPEAARLPRGAQVFVCGHLRDWASVIVVPANGGDCLLPTPTRTKPLLRYRGPCRHGWVTRRFLETVAG